MNNNTISNENLCINKELAYLFGVYLTDGSITNFSDKWGNWCSFSLKTIDRDFAEFTLSCIKKIKPDCKGNVYIQEARTRYWKDGRISKCQKQYCINIGFTSFKDFFEGQTGKKHHIPGFIWDASLPIKKWFIAGIMDGDGWITKKERKNYPGTFQYVIGVGEIEAGWINDFYDFLQKMGISLKEKIRVTTVGILKRKSPLIRFNFVIDSFKSHGLFFTIKRKQDRLKQYIDSAQRLDVSHPTG